MEAGTNGQRAPGENRARVLAYVRECIEAGRPSPSIREIGDAVRISSTSVVDYHLKRLKMDGELTRVGMISRGLALPDVTPVPIGAPVVVVIDGVEVVAPFARLAA